MFSSKVALAVLSIVFQSCAVTIDTSTPTADANYMVLQGDWQYLDSRGHNHGVLNGRVQLVRSAISATSSFSYIIHFSDANAAPTENMQLTVSFARRTCSVIDSDSASPTLYQDPYSCPGYDFATDSNGCDSNYVASNPAVEVAMTCSVAVSGTSSYCQGNFDWDIYIPPLDGDQNVEDTSLVISMGGAEFACANLDARRTLIPGSNQQDATSASLASGLLEKDELGYTHLEMSIDDLVANTEHVAYASASPCSSVANSFAAHVQITSLQATESTDGSGSLTIETYSDSVVDAYTMSVVIVSNSDIVGCFDLETFVFPGSGRNGQVVINPSTSNGCALWEQYYTADAAEGNGKSKKKSKSSKKHKKQAGRDHFDEFESYSVNSQARCCLSHTYDINVDGDGARFAQGKKGKKGGKASRLLGVNIENVSASRTGVFAGVTGAIVLAVGVAMHVQRRRSLPSDISMGLDERTPLTLKFDEPQH